LSTVIWVGNNYAGDFEHWEDAQSDIMGHLQRGGNLILAARYGESFIDEANPATAALYEYCHLTEWSGTVSITQSNPLVSTTYAPDIVDVGPGNGSSSASLAQMCHTDGDTVVTEVFKFTIDTEEWIGGFRVNYPDEGQFVFVSGRPYRLDLDAQRHNYTYILENWFEEPLDVGDEGKGALPKEFALYQNYPNPFNPATLIKFDLPRVTHVKLEIFNVLGQRVTKLVDEARNAGRYSLIWDGRNQSGEEVASGVFFYRIEAGDYTKVRKMTILR
ncbi:MAG: FlgD immunoglobulin-like domain containing protein, partial [Candidatus Zixiibacteriota bacterium]